VRGLLVKVEQESANFLQINFQNFVDNKKAFTFGGFKTIGYSIN
jgi:hypothetical protein